MSFATDRDLLQYELTVFTELAAVAHERLHVTDAAVTGTTLTSASADFAQAQVDAGSVVLVADVAHEVVSRDDAQTLTISLLRASSDGEPIPGGDGAALDLVVRSFAPSLALVHERVMRMLGHDADDPDPTVTVDAVISRRVAAQLEALGTLAHLFDAVRSSASASSVHADKAVQYRSLFAAACEAAVVLLDRDGDGRSDGASHPSLINLIRT